MDKATPVQMRKSLEMSQALKQAMIRFVPIPVLDEVDFVRLMGILGARLDKIEKELVEVNMDFMELLKEWLDLRDEINSEIFSENMPIPAGIRKRERMEELEYEINKRMRGEL